MFKQTPRNAINIVSIILFLIICGNAELIAVNLASRQNSSIGIVSKIGSNGSNKLVEPVRKVQISSNIVNNSSNELLNEKSSKINSRTHILSSNSQLSNAFDQYIIPVNENWSSYGKLTLLMLASDDYYVNKGQDTRINQKANDKNKDNVTSNFTNQAQNMPIQQQFFSITPQKDIQSISILTQNQLKSLESHLNKIQEKVTQSISTQNQQITTNYQALPLVFIKPAQSVTTNSSSNLINNSPNNFAFSSNSPNNSPSSRDSIIQKMKDTVNARFNTFSTP